MSDNRRWEIEAATDPSRRFWYIASEIPGRDFSGKMIGPFPHMEAAEVARDLHNQQLSDAEIRARLETLPWWPEIAGLYTDD